MNEMVTAQFGAAIQMLSNAVDACPEKLWNQKNDFSDFWYIAYHVTFWLDFYLTALPDDYIPYKDFGMSEHDPEGILPERVFSKEEITDYLDHCMAKCKSVLNNLDEVKGNELYTFGTLTLPRFEMMLYNMRHVQHHTGQLNLLLRQQAGSAPKWVRAKRD